MFTDLLKKNHEGKISKSSYYPANNFPANFWSRDSTFHFFRKGTEATVAVAAAALTSNK